MFIAATLSLLSLFAPQNGSAAAQDAKGVLAAREQKTLGDKLRKYLSDEIRYDTSEGKARAKASKSRRSSKAAFN